MKSSCDMQQFVISSEQKYSYFGWTYVAYADSWSAGEVAFTYWLFLLDFSFGFNSFCMKLWQCSMFKLWCLLLQHYTKSVDWTLMKLNTRLFAILLHRSIFYATFHCKALKWNGFCAVFAIFHNIFRLSPKLLA